MLKPNSLRAHLTAAVPELRRDPDKLAISASGGRIVCTAAGGLSFEYRYTLHVVVLGYAGHADAIIVPLLAWLYDHQTEIFDNPELQARSIRFDADYLNKETVDLGIEVDVTERVIVKAMSPDAGGGAPQVQRFAVKHVPEPGRIGAIKQREHWSFYLKDELLAEWDYDPR